MRRSHKQAFTLVELLVVISIIGMLMALLLPAVQQAREAGRSNTCRSNLKNLALAMTQFAQSQNGKLPGYVNSYRDRTGQLNRPALRGSWLVEIMPYIERSDIADLWKDELTPAVVNMELAVCPSDPPEFEESGPLSYVVNCGRSDRGGERQPAANGAFLNKSDLSELYNPRSMSTAYIETNDGASNTMMMSESIHTLTWGFDTVLSQDDSGRDLGVSPRARENFVNSLPDRQVFFGFTWWPPSVRDNQIVSPVVEGVPTNKINATKSLSSPQTVDALAQRPQLASPSSFHPGNVNAAFFDGRVKTMSDGLDPVVYVQLMTSKSKESEAPEIVRQKILDDSEF